MKQLALPLLTAPARPEAACQGCDAGVSAAADGTRDVRPHVGVVVITDPLGGRTEWCRELCSNWARAEWFQFARAVGLPRGAHPAFGFGKVPA